ncbi:MAG: hypothetical protein F4Z57_06695 [Gemmatimonadetes bacterium]|nr:hypothetical protein [Gemmatimonadota bacterium]MYC72879.1 hypothetical protein [Gemmatimonadota bacterium]
MDIQAIRRGFPALEQYTWFQNGGVSIKPVPHGREGLRASITFFLLESEIDELLAALGSLTKQRSKTR